MAVDEAVSLLSIDVAAVTANVAAEALAAEKAYVEALPDDKLFAEASSIEAELAKALAVLEKKKQAAPAPAPPAADAAAPSSSNGPVALFEGTPIDCGAVAAAAVAAQVAALSDAELEKLVADTEAELAKATAAMERKRAAPATPAPRVSFSNADDTTPLASDRTPSPLKRMGESASKLIDATSEKASELLDATSEKTGVPKSTLAATLIGGAVAIGAGLVGALAKRRR